MVVTHSQGCSVSFCQTRQHESSVVKKLQDYEMLRIRDIYLFIFSHAV
jgi:hypothetical protein